MIKTVFTKPADARADLKPFSPRAMRVLIVEDDPLDKTLMARAMEKFGAKRITTTETGEDALRRLERESFDVVLADQGLPRMSGLDLVEIVHQRWPETRIILVTGARNEHVAAAAIKAGAWEYVAKDDFLTSGLIRAVHSAVRTDQHLNRQAIGATTDALQLLRQSQAELRWLRESELTSHSAAFELSLNDVELDRSRGAIERYLEESMISFPLVPRREEDALITVLLARGSSPLEVTRLVEEAMEVMEVSAPQDSTLAFRPSLCLSRLLMRLLQEYQGQIGLAAMQEAA
ncbi:MAG TPA: response regulator [Dehalococcoidia bacterium]|nr:response regulator [Dehalococcoidia bacterium]